MLGAATGSDRGGLLSGHERGTHEETLDDQLTALGQILNQDFTDYDPLREGAQENGGGGTLGWMDLGDLNAAATILLALGMLAIGLADAAREAEREAQEFAEQGVGLLEAGAEWLARQWGRVSDTAGRVLDRIARSLVRVVGLPGVSIGPGLPLPVSLPSAARHGDFHGPWQAITGRPPGGGTWGDYIARNGGGTAPTGMINAHGHHAVMQRGRPGRQRALTEAIQDMFRRRGGIDTNTALDAIGYATNGAGNHRTSVLVDQLQRVRALDALNAPPEAFVELARTLKQEALARSLFIK